MTVPAVSRKTRLPANGTGPYSFNFKVQSEDQLVVSKLISGVVSTLSASDYTVTLTNGGVNGGSITLDVSIGSTSGDYLLIQSATDIEQLTPYANLGAFNANRHETSYDKLTFIAQELDAALEATIKISDFDTGIDTTLPPADGNADRAIILNSTEDGFEYGPSTAEITAAASNAAAAAASAAAAATSESNAATSATNAAASETAAAASATAAANVLNSALWRDVVFVTSANSPITISSSDNGKLYRCDTSGGAITVNLPQISGLTLPFNVSIKKETSDANAITVNRAGSDTIDGATSKTLSTYGGGSTFLADTDPAPDQWTAALFGQAEDGSIVTAKLADSAITTVKIADSNVTTAKIADANVTHDKLSTAFRKSLNLVQDFRLTLTTGTPVTTSDVTGATTVYCTPYTGNSIALYDGTNWNIRTSAEFSLALGTLTSGKPYDVFCYDNAGTPTLEFLVWTDDTTRATALAYQDGVLVKSGTATRRYLGTFYTTATTTTEDSVSKRFLWNYYNRVNKTLFVTDATATWNYTAPTVRQARASAANRVEVVVGVNEDAVSADLQVTFANSSANVTVIAGFGLDSTTVFAADQLRAAARTQVAGTVCSAFAKFLGYVGVGKHYLAWLEYSAATGTTTWTGSNDGNSQTGIRGLIRC